MDIGDIVNDAIRYPTSNFTKVLILGVLLLLSILIIPAIFAFGYIFRALKASIAGFDELPEFDEWGEMFIDGLKVFVVEIVYMIVPGIVLVAGIFLSGAFTVTGTTTAFGPNPAAIMSLGGTFIVFLILALIFGLLMFMALAHMAYNDSELGAAFRFGEILDLISQIGWVDYIIWYLVILVINFVIGVIASIIGSIPYIGFIIVSLLVYPYLYLFTFRALALRYAYE